ncbi:helix-turn-helix transcriptional regulator [Sphingomonas sp. AX6]|uniref:helix-turn-helix transcriptional regulator n=1 Tax=Sphingomonas sp. AX6 TaxID=2653171 RepID=UPI0012F0634A|nr:AraC family transcriptional regulator [Sphingomonas sp. AX6]VXC41139.1 Transcriptional regulator, AraC family [Sphingomonas sp. AX6]
MGDGPAERAGVPLAVFSMEADATAPGEQLAIWRAATAPLFDSSPVGGEQEAFVALIRSYSIGPLLFGRTSSVALHFVRDHAVVARSGVDHLLVQLYVAGGYRGTTSTGPILVEPGDISVLDLAETFETVATGAFDNLNLIVPRAMLAQAGIDVETLHGMVFPRDHALTQFLGNHFVALDGLADTMTVADGEAAADVAFSLLAASLRHAPERTERIAIDPMVGRARRFIELHLADLNLNAERIASDCAMSRASLYRLFEPMGGVAAYIRLLRMRRALFELSRIDGVDARVAAIALRCGYENATSFTRAFQASFGVPPTAVRLSAQRRWPPAQGCRDGAEHPLSDWIRNLLVRHAQGGEIDAEMID